MALDGGSTVVCYPSAATAIEAALEFTWSERHEHYIIPMLIISRDCPVSEVWHIGKGGVTNTFDLSANHKGLYQWLKERISAKRHRGVSLKT